jgi:hypothetical protein
VAAATRRRGHRQAGERGAPDSRLAADLGFDSLMLTELSVALEAAGIALPEAVTSPEWRR